MVLPVTPATIMQLNPGELRLCGSWTATGIGPAMDERQLGRVLAAAGPEVTVDGTQLDALDTAGVLLLQRLLDGLRSKGTTVRWQGWQPRFDSLQNLVREHFKKRPDAVARRQSPLERLGLVSVAALEQVFALLSFIGELAIVSTKSLAHPRRWRVLPVLYNIQSAGANALPIIGLLSFLLGVVIAYQGADQLKQYGANIFVVDLVGLSMLREFSPLLTAIIVAGRSGSAYAAQIGTMAVTEELDALRTIGIGPFEVLVLPKFLALVIVLPLLTVYADVMGVIGGMVMARGSLGVGYEEFLDRLVKAVSVPTYLIGIGKAPIFAAIIAMIGCFQGFRTRGGADSVGRQTTRSVVQAIFLVIVADAIFSVVLSMLDL